MFDNELGYGVFIVVMLLGLVGSGEDFWLMVIYLSFVGIRCVVLEILGIYIYILLCILLFIRFIYDFVIYYFFNKIYF